MWEEWPHNHRPFVVVGGGSGGHAQFLSSRLIWHVQCDASLM